MSFKVSFVEQKYRRVHNKVDISRQIVLSCYFRPKIIVVSPHFSLLLLILLKLSKYWQNFMVFRNSFLQVCSRLFPYVFLCKNYVFLYFSAAGTQEKLFLIAFFPEAVSLKYLLLLPCLSHYIVFSYSFSRSALRSVLYANMYV